MKKIIKFEDYKDLKKVFNYDKAKATRLAEAMTEAATLAKRLDYLNKILEDNKELKPFLWATADGEVKVLHDIDDDHLTNIVRHLRNTGRKISEQIKAEAESRGIDTEPSKTLLIDSSDDDEDDEEDWID